MVCTTNFKLMRLILKINIFVVVSLLLLFQNFLFAQDIKINDIKIFGNKNFSEETILSIGNIKKKNITISLDELNLIQKKYYESNYFSNVEINVIDNILNIKVNENPLINFLIIEGIKEDSLKKDIEKIIVLKNNTVFSESLLNKDIVLIKEYLSSIGYLNSNVKFKVNQLDNNFVNIFLNIIPNNKFYIKNIFFIGDKYFSSSTLSDVVSSTRDSWTSFFKSSSTPSIERLNYDASLLKNFYLNEGFYDVQISSKSFEVLDNKYVNLIFSINSGNKYIFKNFSIENEDFLSTDIKEILKTNFLNIKNTNYSPLKLNKITVNFGKLISRSNDYISLTYSIKKLSINELDVVFRVTKNDNIKTIRNIKVLGNEITEESVIRNNIFFVEGDVYNLNTINQSLDLLKSLSLFKDVKIDTVDNVSNNFVDINVTIVEKPTGEISSGLSVGSSGSSVIFSVKENNFLGKGINTIFDINLGTEQVVGTIYYSDPDFMGTGNTLVNNFAITNSTYANAGYESKEIKELISTQYEIYEDVTFNSGFEVAYDKISVNDGASSIIRTQNGNFLSTKLLYGFNNDKRDKKYKTTSGYTAGFSQGIAFPPSDIPYLTNNFYGSFYHQFSDDFQGVIKYKIKSSNSFNDDPIKLTNRIFLSDSEMRGFANKGIGPKVSDDFIGGNYAYVANLSTSFPNPLPDSWNATTNLFFDLGNIWGSDINGIDDFSKIRSSIGFGFTWTSPLGPIGFSYAEPISKSSTDKIEKFNFRLGSIF